MKNYLYIEIDIKDKKQKLNILNGTRPLNVGLHSRARYRSTTETSGIEEF